MASDYEKETGIRSVNPTKWLEFDGPRIIGIQKNEETWLHHFTAVQLDSNIPASIRSMFETARGAMIYSYFYYPLATLGMEHCFRILELAVRVKANDEKGKFNYNGNIEKLKNAGEISHELADRLHAARSLRNGACHPDGKFLIDPGSALSQLRTTAEIVAELL